MDSPFGIIISPENVVTGPPVILETPIVTWVMPLLFIIRFPFESELIYGLVPLLFTSVNISCLFNNIPVGSADPGQPWSKPKALFSGSELFEPFWKLFPPVNWRELLHTNS